MTRSLGDPISELASVPLEDDVTGHHVSANETVDTPGQFGSDEAAWPAAVSASP